MSELTNKLGKALEDMLLWHDAVREQCGPVVPSPWYIEQCRKVCREWKEADDE